MLDSRITWSRITHRVVVVHTNLHKGASSVTYLANNENKNIALPSSKLLASSGSKFIQPEVRFFGNRTQI